MVRAADPAAPGEETSVFRLDLNGTWTLAWCEPGRGEERGWPTLGVECPNAVSATVPGDVHLDLIEAGVIDEPLHGLNSRDCAWMEEMDWWHSRSFALGRANMGERIELVFGGLDTTADLWLNGEHLGRTNNMHVAQTFDVTEVARAGRNLLVVRLDVGLRAVEGKDLERYAMLRGPEPRVYMRKAQFTFGWDWAPRLATCGIWRPVELRSYRRAALRELCLRTRLGPDGAATVEVLAEVENLTGGLLPAALSLALSRDETHAVNLEAMLEPGTGEMAGEIRIEDPELWWPAPLGEPALYEVTAVLHSGARELERRSFRYGLREVTLAQEPIGEEGRSFVFHVNGEAVYCKGADWVPADSIVARVSPARYRALVGAAAEANFNMLRVWGGGIYEDDCFYRLCDERGILVWQDFLYACAYYPDDDPQFVAEARREAAQAVRRLRNHACLALWCGNNENQWLHGDRAGAPGAPERCLGEGLYNAVLPGVCARLDPTRPYWPSSPWGGPEPNSELEGNRHAWDVSIRAPALEDRIDYERYAEDRGKFICEFGVLAPPPPEGLRRYLPPGELSRDCEPWAHHNNRFEKGTNQEALRRYWRPAEDLSLDEYVRYSQLIQAEALSFAVEHWRRRKFRTGGALLWMYADCWGEVGWTVIDYYLNRKPSYYAVRRACAPVLASLKREEDGVGVWLVNDMLRAVPGELTAGWLNVRTGEMTERTEPAEAPANAAREATRLALPEGELDAWTAYARFARDAEVLSRNRLFLAGFHFNRLALPAVRLAWRLAGDPPALEVGADGFAWQVHVEAPRGVWVEDNDFDLLPGEARTVPLRGPAPLCERVRVCALNETERE